MWFELAGDTATVVGTIGFVWYAVSICKGETRPSRMTWFILTTISLLVAVVNFEMEASSTLGVYVMSVLGSLLIFILSIFKGVGGWGYHDRIAFFGVLLAVTAWLLSTNPLYSLLIALSFDFWGLYPTIIKVARNPETEAWLPWVITFVSSVLNFIALNPLLLGQEIVDIGISPIYYLFMDGLITGLILLPFVLHRPLLR